MITLGTYDMTTKEFNIEMEALRKGGEEVCKTPATARAFLVKAGIIKKKGGLTKRYGGK